MIVTLVISAAVGISTLSITASAKADYDQAPSASRAVFADGRLWMMDEGGALLSLSSTDLAPELSNIPSKVIDICKSDGHLLVLTQAGRDRWFIHRRSSAGWIMGPEIADKNDRLVALGCVDDAAAIAIVTDRRVIEVQGNTSSAVHLSEPLKPPFGLGTALISGNNVWVGFNIGEWGGGLRRIDRRDGKITTIESNISGKLCSGPLNSNCDPVNSLVPSPYNPSCIVAAIGLVHLISHGRIIDICDGQVRRRFFKVADPQPPYGRSDDGEPSSTVAFSGLARVGSTLWALGTGGLYRFDAASPPQFRPLPSFENRGGYQVSFDVPGIVLLLTDVNQRNSVGGAVPIMATR